jgi:hypothetical protein
MSAFSREGQPDPLVPTRFPLEPTAASLRTNLNGVPSGASDKLFSAVTDTLARAAYLQARC